MVEGNRAVEGARPRRKRVGEEASKSNGHSENGNGKVGAPYKSTRRKRVVAKRKQKTKTRPLVVGIYIVICSFIGLYTISRNRGTPSIINSESQLHAQSQTSGKEDIESILLSKVSDGIEPLTSKQELDILLAAHDELNQFPLSVGTDKNGDNPDWETILHPGTEAFQLGLKNGDAHHTGKKKRPSAQDIAGVLSGKKLRGANNDNSNEEDGSEDSDDNKDQGYMRVPKFWDPVPYRIIADEREKRSDNANTSDLPRDGVRRYLGNFGSRLMTPTEAKSIGSRVPSSSNDGQLLETIYVAIASYRDFQCSQTVESIFKRAAHPERIRVAVIDQIRLDIRIGGEDMPCSVPPEGPCDINPEQATCKYQSHIDYFTMDAELSVGPVFARHLGHRLYRGEYFAMQSDAHVEFVLGWDDEIIEQWHTAKNEMAILSTYLSGVEKHMNVTTGKRTSKARPIMCQSDFEGQGDLKHLRHGQQPEGTPHIHDMPTLNPFWAAGFSFARGHFVVNIPYDQHLPWIFQGEEISIGLRGFSYGYDYYSPEKAACYHYYHRKNIPLFWENSSTYRGSGIYGMNRLNSIIHMASHPTNKWVHTDEIKYGLGKVRETQLFFDVFGIHIKEQRVEKHLCKFVGRPMQDEFIPALRSNAMGLDYEKITYRFVDKWPNEK